MVGKARPSSKGDDLWVEKYRPSTLEEVVGQQDIIPRLLSYVKTRNLPHMLFAGTAGTGKTTSAIALARGIFGMENYRGNFKELNASDDRGIGVVRGQIKDFARTAPMGDTVFKIIFLDEADALTSDAQAALRRTMEKYTHTCRFILSCNYSSKIIEPIQSRCAVFRFRPLKPEDIRSYLEHIAKTEGLEITEDAYDALLYIAGGDMRKAITSLQVGATMGKKLDSDTLYRTSATARPEDVRKLIEAAFEARDFVEARNHLDNLLIDYGLSGEDVVKQVHRSLLDLSIPDAVKVALIEKVGEIEYRLVEGSNERIQLEALLASFVLRGDEVRKG